ncbi:MAG: hypothetical protein ACTSUV_03390 [Candidatus Ranarchaeia archaeon]
MGSLAATYSISAPTSVAPLVVFFIAPIPKRASTPTMIGIPAFFALGISFLNHSSSVFPLYDVLFSNPPEAYTNQGLDVLHHLGPTPSVISTPAPAFTAWIISSPHLVPWAPAVIITGLGKSRSNKFIDKSKSVI